MRTFVITDIHGASNSFKDVLKQANFDYEKDRLINLGDTFDRGYDPVACVREMMKMKNLVYILGNHDAWTLKYLKGEFDVTTGPYYAYEEHRAWWTQGGAETFECLTRYGGKDIEEEMGHFLCNSERYYIDGDRLFTHAGILPGTKVEHNSDFMLQWDRELVETLLFPVGDLPERIIPEYSEVFIGHTPTVLLAKHKCEVPLKLSNVWLCDTGALYKGKLSIMNVDTKEVFQAVEPNIES